MSISAEVFVGNIWWKSVCGNAFAEMLYCSSLPVLTGYQAKVCGGMDFLQVASRHTEIMEIETTILARLSPRATTYRALQSFLLEVKSLPGKKETNLLLVNAI